MSWYADPQLFIGYWDSCTGFIIDRIVKKHNVPLVRGDVKFVEKLDFSNHLSLGSNKASDYDALKSSLAKDVDVTTHEYVKFVNCQGLVVHWNDKKSSGNWAPDEEVISIINGLPGMQRMLHPETMAEKTNSELVAENFKLNSEVTYLQKQLHQEKTDKEALEKEVLDLTAKLEECRGSGGGSDDVQPWMSGTTVPNNWVPFDDLDKQDWNTSLTITEGPSMPKFVDDVSTNVQVNCFHRGKFIVAVNVAELAPDNEKARFDPDIWGLYKNAGITYAARKPLESEMSVSPHKTG